MSQAASDVPSRNEGDLFEIMGRSVAESWRTYAGGRAGLQERRVVVAKVLQRLGVRRPRAPKSSSASALQLFFCLFRLLASWGTYSETEASFP